MNRNPNDKEVKNGQRSAPSYNTAGTSVRRPSASSDRTPPKASRQDSAVRQSPVSANPQARPQSAPNTRQARPNETNAQPRQQTYARQASQDQKASKEPSSRQAPARRQEPIKAAAPKAGQNPPVDKQNVTKQKKPRIMTRVASAVTAPPSSSAPSRHRKNDFIKPTDIVRIKGSYDKLFLILVIILTLFGIIMDFSASYAYAYSKFGDSFYFVKQQILYAGIGMIFLFVAMNFDYRWMRKLTVPLFIVVILLLLAVLMYGVASGVAQRWITLGPITFQPSEFMKPALVLMLALYVARNQDRITNYRNFKQSTIYGMIIPFLIVGVACLLIFLEKHFSGTIIVFAIGAVVIFAAGARMGWFVGAVVAVALLLGIAIMFVPYAQERVNMLLFPENYDPTGKIWQTLQGLYAIGSGGLFGVGLGNSRQKHMYVSQPQNDFIFSIIAEELGFAGAALVIILFMLLIWRGFVIALKAPDTFSSLVVIGLISKVAIQAVLNIAVVTNTIPNTGISLPFFSYGGTALVVQLAEMGVILCISKYSYQKKEALNI